MFDEFDVRSLTNSLNRCQTLHFYEENGREEAKTIRNETFGMHRENVIVLIISSNCALIFQAMYCNAMI